MDILNHKEQTIEKNSLFSFNQQEEPFDDYLIHFIPQQKQVSINGVSINIQHHSAWEYKSKNESFTARLFLMGENILLSRLQGKMSTADATATYTLIGEVLKETNITRYYYIEDLRKLLLISRQTRNKIKKSDKALEAARISTHLILPHADRTLYTLFNTAYRKNVSFSPTLKAAILECMGVSKTEQQENEAKTPSASSSVDLQQASKEDLIAMVSQLKEENATLKTYQKQRLSHLNSTVGQILWGDHFDFQAPKLSTDDDYFELYQSFSILLKDFQQLATKRSTPKNEAQSSPLLFHTADKINTATEKSHSLHYEHLQTLGENIGDLACLLTPNGIISYMASSVEHILGYTTAEVSGKSIFRYIHPEDTSLFLSSGHSNFFLRDRALVEFRVLKKDHTYVWLEALSTAIKNEEEEIGQIIVSAREHDEKKQLAIKLSIREEELKSTLEGMSESVYVFDKNGLLVTTNQQKNKDYFIEYANDALVGKAYQEIFADSFIQKLDKAIRIVCTTQIKHEFEYTLERNKEEQSPDHYKIFVLARKDISGSFAGITMITRNVTASKRLKEQNTELEKANEELDHFVYSASHDLRAPLASTLGLINITRITDDLEEKIKYLNLMESSLKKMDRYIHDITDYSRNARLTIDLEKIEFKELIDDVIQTLSYHENTGKIDFVVKTENTTPFFSDYSRLNIIFRNVISNAVKYHDLTRPHPFLAIDIKITEKEGVFRFEDNGIGIEEKYIDNIFDMFYQASPESFGSGLGLYIVKEALNKLKGTIKVASVPTQGSVFTFTIPNLTEKLS